MTGAGRRGWAAVRAVIWASSALTVVAAVALPWRWFPYANPLGLGSHLYQVRASLLVVLVVLALASAAVAPWLDQRDWPSLVVVACGVAVTFCAVSVHATDHALVASSLHRESGYALAFVCGLVTAGAGAVGAVLRFRRSRRPAPAGGHAP